MTTKYPFITGWCGGPNHHKCNRFYEVRGKDYMCECECHSQRRIKKIPRPPATKERSNRSVG